MSRERGKERKHSGMKLVLYSEDGQIHYSTPDLSSDPPLRPDVTLSLIGQLRFDLKLSEELAISTGLGKFCREQGADLSSVHYAEGCQLSFSRVPASDTLILLVWETLAFA